MAISTSDQPKQKMMRSRTNGKNFTHQIVEDLGVAILTGKYSNANRFPIEAELCSQYGASRSIVREAVKMLTAKGLLGARPGKGTKIQPEENWNLLDPDVLRWLLDRKFSPALLIEFTQVRLAVEPKAAAFAALNATATDKMDLQKAIYEMTIATGGASDDSLEADIAFHITILRASKNRFFSQMRELIESTLRFSIRATNSYKGVSKASVADHKKVSDAIVAGDSEQAEIAMREIVQEALELIDRGTRSQEQPSLTEGRVRKRRIKLDA